jgi:hypothetical protein
LQSLFHTDKAAIHNDCAWVQLQAWMQRRATGLCGSWFA